MSIEKIQNDISLCKKKIKQEKIKRFIYSVPVYIAATIGYFTIDFPVKENGHEIYLKQTDSNLEILDYKYKPDASMHSKIEYYTPARLNDDNEWVKDIYTYTLDGFDFNNNKMFNTELYYEVIDNIDFTYLNDNLELLNISTIKANNEDRDAKIVGYVYNYNENKVTTNIVKVKDIEDGVGLQMLVSVYVAILLATMGLDSIKVVDLKNEVSYYKNVIRRLEEQNPQRKKK